ncbi:MAG: DNA methyltransferase [Polyangiaceae bacterium]
MRPACRRRGGRTASPNLVFGLLLLVRASSLPGATVADLMCGSGTTLVAAARLGRHFVGADRSPAAIDITRARLAAEQIAHEMLGAPPDNAVAGEGHR